MILLKDKNLAFSYECVIMKNYAVRAIVSDLDWTLVYQTEGYFTDVVGGTMQKLGFPYDASFARRFWLEGNRDKLIVDTLKIPYMDFWHVFWKLDSPEVRASYTEVYPDVIVLRNLMKERNLQLGIVTNAVSEVAYAEIAKMKRKVPGLEVKAVVPNDPDDIMKTKPDVKPFYTCVNMLCVKPEEVILLGDNDEDIELGRRVGVPTAIINRHENSNLQMPENVTTIDSLHELEKFL